MNIENPLAFGFIFQEDLYLSVADKAQNAWAREQTPAKAATPLTLETPSVTFNYKGKNKKGLLVLVHYPEHDFMADHHLAALENTLKRLEYTPDDIAVLNIANNQGTNLEQLSLFFTPKKLLILGVNALPAGVPAVVKNQPVHLNECRTLYTFSFDEMMDSQENKKVFWEQIKQF